MGSGTELNRYTRVSVRRETRLRHQDFVGTDWQVGDAERAFGT